MEMTITSGDQSVKTSMIELERLGKHLKSQVNYELLPINLKEYADRIGKLSEERKEISDFISSIYEEAENKGFDKKALKAAIKMLKLEKEERERQMQLTDLYLEQIG
jgi:uncharacterized protein (UPF0335 family)